jgi:hypothetical protein
MRENQMVFSGRGFYPEGKRRAMIRKPVAESSGFPCLIKLGQVGFSQAGKVSGAERRV